MDLAGVIVVALRAVQQLFDAIERGSAFDIESPPQEYLDARDAVRQAKMELARTLGRPEEGTQTFRGVPVRLEDNIFGDNDEPNDSDNGADADADATENQG